jgi:hypothetical protein
MAKKEAAVAGADETSVARAPAASTALAPIGSGEMFLRLPRELTPPVYGMMREVAKDLFDGGMVVKGLRSPAAVLTVMLKAHELGIPPVQGLSHIHIIEGKPTLSAELMLALILRAFPAALRGYPQLDDHGCVIELARPGGVTQRFGFSMADAAKAGLSRKQVWGNYPRAMCRSRAISEAARSMFPDVLMGCSYTPEELGASVGVNSEGHVEVIDAEVIAPRETSVEPGPPTPVQAAVVHVEQYPAEKAGHFYARYPKHIAWLAKKLSQKMLAEKDIAEIAAKLDGHPFDAGADAYQEWLNERDEPAEVFHPEEGLGKPLAPGERPTA